MPQLLEYHSVYENMLRVVFAQAGEHTSSPDPDANLVSVFDDEGKADITFRARTRETDEERSKYILRLGPESRMQDGSPAIVKTLDEFRSNFACFSDGSLGDMDWSNVVAAGGSVCTALLPVPPNYKRNTMSQSGYYNNVVAPESDVDLFLYGLTEAQAIQKIRGIHAAIKKSMFPKEPAIIRTKHAITFVNGYPTRHVQVILRLYQSPSAILTGFDVDCSCVAYDGHIVYASPRGLAAYIFRINTVDLTRRSPSFETRLFKYFKRGFEVHWPQLERSKIDKCIYINPTAKPVGLALLLVLPNLKKRSKGIKDNSMYATFFIPYGPGISVENTKEYVWRKFEKLNSEWARRKSDRGINLHRHPAFCGTLNEIFEGCKTCPVPKTSKEIEISNREKEIYVSGPISFITQNPSQQGIGSFNQVSADGWTDMAYGCKQGTHLHGIKLIGMK